MSTVNISLRVTKITLIKFVPVTYHMAQIFFGKVWYPVQFSYNFKFFTSISPGAVDRELIIQS